MLQCYRRLSLTCVKVSMLFVMWVCDTFVLTYLAVDTDNLSAGGDDSSASRPRYYDTVDDNAQMQSVPSIASGYLKTEPSSTNTAVYNEVAKKLMVCLIILIIKSISQFTRRVFVYDKIWSVIRTILTFITPLIEGCTLYTWTNKPAQ